MKIKSLMVGSLLAVMILSAIGGAVEISAKPTFFTLCGQVSDGFLPVNGAVVSLTINGVTHTTVTAPNNHMEGGYYQFELANFPDAPAGTTMILSATAASVPGTSAFLRVSREAVGAQIQDLTLTASGTGVSLSVDAEARSTVAGVSPASYVLTLTNPGNHPETYTLTIQNPQNAIASLDTSTITLDGHMSGTVQLYVTGATAGSYVVDVTATYPDSDMIKTISTTTTVYSGGKITGDGSILSGSFDIAGQYPDQNGVAKGSVIYQDKSANLKIKSIQISSVGTTPDNTKGVITGLAQVNGEGSYYFEVYVEDNGITGKGKDVFWIYLPTYPYSNSGVLSSGNIQIN